MTPPRSPAPSRQAKAVTAFMRSTLRSLPRISDALTISFARRFFRAPPWVRAHFGAGLVRAHTDLGGVPCESIAPPTPRREGTVLYFHGGGYFCGSPLSYRHVTSTLARRIGCRVLIPDYHLAPEHPFPAAADDALAAYQELLAAGVRPERLVLVGDSAGGALVLATMAAARERGLPLPACGVCLSPWSDLAGTGDSIHENADTDALFQPGDLPRFAAIYLAGAPATDPRASPFYADLRGLPPLLVHVSGSELLRDDGLRVAAKIEAAGGYCEVFIADGLPHVWHLLLGLVPEAHRDVDAVAVFAARHLGNGRPKDAPAAD